MGQSEVKVPYVIHSLCAKDPQPVDDIRPETCLASCLMDKKEGGQPFFPSFQNGHPDTFLETTGWAIKKKKI